MSQVGPKDVLPVLGDWGEKVVVCMNKYNYRMFYMDTYKTNTYISQGKIFWLLLSIVELKMVWLAGAGVCLCSRKMNFHAPSPECMCGLGLGISILPSWAQ